MVAPEVGERRSAVKSARALVAAVVAYVVVLPLLAATIAADVFAGKSLVLADLAFVAVACAFIGCGMDRRLPLRRDVTALATLLVATLLAVALFTGGHRPALVYVARVTYSMVVLVLLAHVRFSDRERRWIVGAWVGTVLVLSSVSALGYAAEVLLGLPANTFADSPPPASVARSRGSPG